MTPELRHMLRDDDLSHEEQKQVLELAIKFSKNRFYKQPFAGPQAIAVLFDKPSTRTRSSFSKPNQALYSGSLLAARAMEAGPPRRRCLCRRAAGLGIQSRKIVQLTKTKFN